MDDALPPIPTPAAHGWRRMRQQFLPGIVFIGGVAGVTILWTQGVSPTSLVGETETIRAEARSTQAGTLTQVLAKIFQPVRAGDTLAHVMATDPQILEASLAVIRAEIQVMRQTTEQRTLLDYERLMLDLMSERVKLAALKSQLHQAESTLARAKSLYAGKLLTEERFEEAQNTRDALQAQVAAQTELVARVDPDRQGLGPTNQAPPPASPAQALRASIKLQEERLRLAEAQLRPIPLIAPIDGIVTLAFRQPGEVVVAGEPIFQITAAGSQHIIGFLRQPGATTPTPGTAVEVRTRSLPRRTGTAVIAQVGTHLEPITPTLLAALHLPVTNPPTELGLRMHVTVPTDLALRPGEQVDLLFRD
ncbi:MAG: HlyD family efflux transporter periplasmic adaptor subunit [Opitutaceae bacterium]|nr:HlyD family efflux transporter periplasmic adaptor subunit [Opitutaceae bacterium]